MSATIYYCTTGKLVPAAVERIFEKEDPLAFDGLLPGEAEKKLRNGLAVKRQNRMQTVEELISSIAECLKR